jgi:hypothetical protein
MRKQKTSEIVAVKPAPNQTPLAEFFLKILYSGSTEFHSIYRSLFKILTLKELDDILSLHRDIWSGKDEYFGADGKEVWFTVFHKAIRQTDFFCDVYRENIVETLTPKELKEYWFLRHKVHEEGYVKEGDAKELFNPEYRRYLELFNKYQSRKRPVSLGGHLDSVLWNIIHLDNKEVLHNAMLLTFEEIES